MGCTIYAESERVRSTIAFESIRYGEIFTNETLDIYGIDLPEGIFKQHFLQNSLSTFAFCLNVSFVMLGFMLSFHCHFQLLFTL